MLCTGLHTAPAQTRHGPDVSFVHMSTLDLPSTPTPLTKVYACAGQEPRFFSTLKWPVASFWTTHVKDSK
ncbi:hypothetical protein chiPu_0003376 [Chiloscyllium punctatum]|uniref:Uncharacterized protein n=1 Tax=Chiloscyllium punctatum TaxID=137246 RepID=A0A401S3I1_CHIPU|nr:hypothetical protein [Chiloscyllium punctatum]